MFENLQLREGWTTVLLLLITLLCVAWSIQGAHWTTGLTTLQAVVLVGGILGILLAKSRLPNRMAHLLSLLAGLTWAVYLTCRTLASATGLSTEVAVVELEWRFQDWLTVVFSGGTTAGTYVFILLLSLLLWLMAYICAWAIFRWQRVWWAVILSGVALMVNVTYAPANLTGFLIAFLVFALLLVVRTSLAFYEQEWRAASIGYSPELVYAFLRAGLVVTVLAILFAWFAPDALASRPMQQVWDRVSQPWRKLQDQSSRVFQDLNYRSQPVFITFGRSTRFGGAVELTDAPVIDIKAATGRYWRVMVFHDYTGNGWDNTDIDTILIGANEQNLATPDVDLRREVTQTVTLAQDLGPQGIIAAAGQPLRAGIPLQAVVSLVTRQELPDEAFAPSLATVAPGDASVLYSQVALKAGESYEVVSSLTRADQESLRQASTDYPGWIAPRYLQLPDSLPKRVIRLARDVTEGQENPYDKAAAIEHYLREIPYNETIDAPATGQDGVDYFLFDVEEGYCDYYASAMVVMLRAVGVPARYVRGFSQGHKEDGVYHVLEKDSHAWPEVFFPGYGWVEFEPTAGEPVLVRPRSQDSTAQAAADARDRFDRQQPLEDPGDGYDYSFYGQSRAPTSISWQQIRRWGGLALCFVAFVLVSWALHVVRRRRHIQGLSIIERVYQDLEEWVRRILRISPLAHQTPYEYAGSVAAALPKGRQAVEEIADLYVRERFGSKSIPGEEAEVAWRDVWGQLRHHWLWRRTKRARRLIRWLIPEAEQQEEA
jgi:transglutaminase-like putative cysteine protease